MNFIIENWLLLFIAGVFVAAAIFNAKCMVQMPRDKQIAVLLEWLKYAVTEAEKQLGSGTGQIKLRLVYNMALERFDWVGKLLSFEAFSECVDEALVWMRSQIESNKDIKAYTEGGE